MSAILFITGTTRGDALGAIMRALGRVVETFGYEAIEVNVAENDAFSKLEKVVNEKHVLLAYTAAGIGRDVVLPDGEGKTRNLWEVLNIPFITVNGDSPAYYFDRHVNPSDNFAVLYGFREHYALRKRLPDTRGLFGIAMPLLFDLSPLKEIDFAAKEKGKLIFLKNGGDPDALKAAWKTKFRPYIQRILFDLADLLESNMATDPHVDIDELVCELFKTKGIDIDAQFKLRLFFVAQLDDYLRRAKCNFMGHVLRDFPVEIRGNNWNHIDFAGKPCTYIDHCDYNESVGLIKHSLGIIDMSPNTQGGFHDRPQRSFSAHTLCLTNQQDCFAETFPDHHAQMTFNFDRDSMAERINAVLSRPKEHVELGIEAARIFNAQFSHEQFVHSLLELADVIRLGTGSNPGIQDYFVWPPAALNLPR